MALKIIGCGKYLPNKVITNFDLESSLDTSDEWIKSRTGISQRHIAATDEWTSHLGAHAAEAAIKDAGIDRSDIDLVICCTTTPDNSFPSVATKVQGYLGLKSVPSFDLQAVCSGFIYGLHIAEAMSRSLAYKTILLLCPEKMSSLLDWTDRSTSVLFGDGAGAVILQHSPTTSGIIDSQIFSDGSHYDILKTDGGVSMNGNSGKITMNGREVFRQAVEKMSLSVSEILKKNNISIAEVTHFIPHQANIRIIKSVAERLGFDFDKITVTVDRHANCSAGSIPLALAEANETGTLKEGDIIVFTAFGAGATWGSAIVRW